MRFFSAKMNIYTKKDGEIMAIINGQEVFAGGQSLLKYLQDQGFDVDRLAVEVNGTIIKRGTYGDYVINESDKVEIVCFVGGG